MGRTSDNTRNLTERYLKALTAGQREYLVWDSEVRGLGVRVHASGVKSFVVQYRNAHRRTRRLALGKVGVLRLEQARKLARHKLEEVARGADPSAERHRAGNEPTVANLAERYLAEHALHKKPRSRQEDERNLRLHVLPQLGRLPVSAVTRGDIEMLRRVMKDRPIGFNRVRALLSKMFNLAERWGMREQGSNPCALVEKYPEKERERLLSSDEWARLGAALEWAETSRAAPAVAIAAIRMLLFTGCRRDEILTLEWTDRPDARGFVDLEAKVLVLKDAKTGPQRLPLNTAAIDVLQQITGNHSRWVIPGGKPDSHLVGIEKIWHRIRKRAGLEDVRLHDLRHQYGSAGVAIGYGLPKVGRLLGHHSERTTKRYAHFADEPLREATEAIGEHLRETLRPRLRRVK